MRPLGYLILNISICSSSRRSNVILNVLLTIDIGLLALQLLVEGVQKLVELLLVLLLQLGLYL